MKKDIVQINSSVKNFEEYKQIIDTLISNKQIDLFKKQNNYFDLTGNFWIVDKYIAKGGQVEPSFVANTFSAFDNAIEAGYAISIPVQILDDDSIVCFSHKNISKVIPNESGYLNKLNLKEIKQMKLGEKQEQIPTLDEALAYIAGRTPIIIEIHNDGTIGKFEDKVISSIKQYIKNFNCYNQIAIMSINPYSLQYCYENYPYITRILKSGQFTEKMYGSISTRKLKKLKLSKLAHADFLCYSAELLPCRAVKKHKFAGVIASNVINQNQYMTVAKHCDNIIFNNFKPTI